MTGNDEKGFQEMSPYELYAHLLAAMEEVDFEIVKCRSFVRCIWEDIKRRADNPYTKDWEYLMSAADKAGTELGRIRDLCIQVLANKEMMKEKI